MKNIFITWKKIRLSEKKHKKSIHLLFRLVLFIFVEFIFNSIYIKQ